MSDSSVPTLTWAEFAGKYCARQESTPADLWAALYRQQRAYQPAGWMLLECHMLDSSSMGNFTILPYGPKNTYREPPNHPVSPKGLASDMSVVVALLLATELPTQQPEGDVNG